MVRVTQSDDARERTSGKRRISGPKWLKWKREQALLRQEAKADGDRGDGDRGDGDRGDGDRGDGDRGDDPEVVFKEDQRL